MKLIAINGSPRRNWNTATVLTHVVNGAASQGADAQLIHLIDIKYQGCISCFSCKLKNGKSYGKCSVQDGLTPILDTVRTVDALVVGSPIYLGSPTGLLRSFIERLLFPYIAYDKERTNLFGRKIRTGLIYTMNHTESMFNQLGLGKQLEFTELLFKRTFGHSETITAYDTYQFDDYDKYVSTGFDKGAKARRREEVFPDDCKKAFDMGVRFSQESNQSQVP